MRQRQPGLRATRRRLALRRQQSTSTRQSSVCQLLELGAQAASLAAERGSETCRCGCSCADAVCKQQDSKRRRLLALQLRDLQLRDEVAELRTTLDTHCAARSNVAVESMRRELQLRLQLDALDVA